MNLTQDITSSALKTDKHLENYIVLSASISVAGLTNTYFIPVKEMKPIPQAYLSAQQSGDYKGVYSYISYVGGNYVMPYGFGDSYKVGERNESVIPYNAKLDTSIKNYAYIASPDSIGEYFTSISETIKSFSTLQEKWDSYNAKKISWYAIIEALLFFMKFSMYTRSEVVNIPEPFVAPLASGGIQIEWETLFRKFHFRIPVAPTKGIEYLKIEIVDGEEVRSFETAKNIDDVFCMVSDWLLNIKIKK